MQLLPVASAIPAQWKAKAIACRVNIDLYLPPDTILF